MGSIYTLGYANLGIESFIGLLKSNEVDVVCDVRSMPYSRLRPDYSRKTFKSHLNNSGIKYAFFGDELGARPSKGNVYVEGQALYGLISKQEYFQRGLSRIRSGIQSHNLALICAEKDPIECHRCILVCRNLPDLNGRIFHLHHSGRKESQPEVDARLAETLGVAPPPLLEDHDAWEQAINEAYRIQSRKIAYTERLPTAQPAEDRMR